MSDSHSPVSTTETALTIARAIAGAAPPPWGPALGGAADVIGSILGFFFPSDDSSPGGPTLQQIIAGIAQQFASADIKHATDHITATADTFVSQTTFGANAPLPKSVKEALTQDPAGIFANLYNFINEAVTGNNPSLLIEPLTSMATDVQGDICLIDGDLPAAYLPTFAYGVSTYLLMTTYWVGLAASVEGPDAVDDMSLYVAINNLNTTPFYGHNGWIAYAQAVVDTFRQAVTQRATHIGVATPFTYNAGGYFSEAPAVYFADVGEPVANFNPSTLVLMGPNRLSEELLWPGNIPLSRSGAPGVVFCCANPDSLQDVTDRVEELRTRYVDGTVYTLFDNYFNPDVMQETIDAWKKCLAKLQSANQARSQT